MRIDHGRADVLVPQKFLNRSNIITVFQKVRGKGMPKCVATRFRKLCFGQWGVFEIEQTDEADPEGT